ncbi:pimeloyl-ACP methyl esterase BioG family protein [Limimaricola pyoseonensis]|uniref:Biotin synthesis protein BioG n=1 Tax=Limimaricola pyoseonensis TaxID=521013 RepID=A0A1G6ZQA5_9RHOB|nr:pimeloyl-ACP methyl esterase BioG family protein [Limimaricola pyoseonensis]SDE04407.1 biotin synthesis protein BioG [Limimaricola pyoseonensis]
MRWRWLSGPGGADRVVTVFGGWAAGPAALAHLTGADVLYVEDWRDLDADLPNLSGYARRDLVAWSFGVAAYGHWQAGRETAFDRRIALCGSPAPVDRAMGIPPAIFQRTRDRLDPVTLASFLDRIGAPPVASADIPALRDELDAVAARGPASDVAWDRVVIATGDRIFPPANLHRAFAGRTVEEVDAPHTPFDLWSRWEEVTG